MRRLLLVLAALLGLASPAHAIPPAWMGNAACNGLAVSVAFGGSNPSCYAGRRLSSPLSTPGWSFTGGAATNGIVDVDCNGLPVAFVSGTPRIMCNGLSVWQAATNSFLNSAVGATQTVTTTAASWTLSFWGTGSIAGTGACTISLAGTGATKRVSVTITATAGSCVLTVSGSATNVQYEAGAFATPVATTIGAAVTRSADLAKITGLTLGSGGTLYVAATRTVVAGTQGIVSLNSGASTNRIDIRQSATQTSSIGTAASVGLWTIAFNFTSTAGVPFRAAVSYKAGAQALSYNGGGGGAMGTATAASIPTLANQLQFGGLDGSTGNPLNGYIQRAAIYAQPSAAVLAQ